MAILSLLLATSMLPGFRIDTGAPNWWVAMFRMPLIFAFMLILLRPLLLFLTLPLNSLTLGLPTLLFNGLILYLTAKVEPAFIITNYGQALLGSLIMTVVSTSLVGWLGLDEAYPFFQSLIYRLGRRFGPQTEGVVGRGLLILQIDGLALTSLGRVLERGRMPAISAMLAKGTHRLHAWHCGIPSNTPAVQAGFLYGNRENVAGYRWFDRQEQKVRVVSQPEDLRRLEAMVAAEGRPLLEGGSCINSFMAGGAAKRLMTVSALGQTDRQRSPGEKADFNLFFLSPNAYTKAVLAAVWDYFTGLILAGLGRFQSDRPRLKFSIKRVAQRAVANAFLRDLSFFWVKQDMTRGVPVIYSNFVGYDDVAHYSGPETYDAQIALAAFDRRLRKLRRLAKKKSPLRYDLLIFSDHGQTLSIPYRLLNGETIEQTLAGILGRAVVTAQEGEAGFNPDASYVASLLAELEEVGTGSLGWAAHRGQRTLSRITAGVGGSRPQAGEPAADADEAGEADEGAAVVVCVSGSLAHIYFKGHDEPLHLETICELFPGLVEELSRHPGIGFVAASRRYGDAVAIGPGGLRNLITGELVGEVDPLGVFPPPDRWAGELAQLLGFPDSGDLVINGAWLGDQQKVVVFEEQTSSHGGLGGPQTQPFVLMPAHWHPSLLDLESPEALHGLVRRQLASRIGPEGRVDGSIP